VVTVLSPEEQTLTVRIDEDERIDFDGLDELAHAYAITSPPHRTAVYGGDTARDRVAEPGNAAKALQGGP
jgi:hypothetical protein